MMYREGFTIIELFLAVSITFIVGMFVFPMAISFLGSQTLEDTTSGVLNTLRKAQGQAQYAQDDSAHGVKILSETYVLFVGDSYALRDAGKDEIFTIAASISMGGLSEVVFQKDSGIPDMLGTITLTRDGATRVIDISENGKIER